MSKKKKSERRHISAGKLNPAAKVHAARGRRGLFPAIITMAVIILALAVWLGLHPSGVSSGIESSGAAQPGRVDAEKDQSSGAVAGGPSIYISEPSYDFGAITQGAVVSHTFTVKNTGNEPLKLIKAKAS
jgi:hypothetical protein